VPYVALCIQLLIAALWTPTSAQAQEDPGESMVVATKVSPPFAIKQPDGQWTGISIELWERLAKELDLPPPTYLEMPLEKMFSALEEGRVSAAVAAISVTPEREHRVDFTHPYHSTGLGVAVSAERAGGLAQTLASRLLNWKALAIVVGSILWLLLIALIFWLAERRANPLYKGAGARKGLGLGIWWTVTILLGNKGILPTSPLSRLLAFGGMLTSVLLLATVTGAIASYLTVSQLDHLIRQPQDLRNLRVVTPGGTTSEEFLRQIRVSYTAVQDPQAGIEAVARGRADAIVYDAPALKYLANTTYANRIKTLPPIFQRQEYAIALVRGSPLRKLLNESLLRLRRQKWWEDLLYRYLGNPA
jgi:ABC-type amino acid transport substrate-binding protein